MMDFFHRIMSATFTVQQAVMAVGMVSTVVLLIAFSRFVQGIYKHE